jgi:putative hemolysin
VSRFLEEIAFILLLVGANGLFAMAELAVLSARRPRLRQLAESGDRRARVALDLVDDPNRFLSTVQVGITTVGTLAGAFGGATLAEELAARIGEVPGLAPYAEAIGLGVVVAGIAYVSLVLGELVPKRLALGRPERIALAVAIPLRLLSIVAIPVVRLLAGSTELVLRAFGVRAAERPPITEEEVKILIQEGARAGVFEPAEQEMIQRVFRLDNLRASTLMTRRAEIVWIDPADPPDRVRLKVTGGAHSRFPVCDGGLDKILGIVRARDLLAQVADGRPFDLRGLLRMPLLIYERMPALRVLERFQRTGTHIALVLDEFGGVGGLLTLHDIMEAIVGALPPAGEPAEPRATRRPDGSWLLDGRITRQEFEDLFPPARLPEGDYETLAGFILAHLGRIPQVADRFEWGGFRFEIMDMDGNRIDQILVTPPPRDE